jgi:hypothetical protein
MLDYEQYTTDSNDGQGDGNGYQDNGFHGNGYDQLDGEFALFYKVARGFTRRVKQQDGEDFLHDLFVAFMKVKANYDAKDKELTQGGLVRIAQYEVSHYWQRHFKRINGVDCRHCSKAQRAKCREHDLYRECQKAITLESLDRVIEDGEGNTTPLHEMIADDKATDLVAWTEARIILEGYPTKAVKLLCKRYMGYPLKENEQRYLNRFRKKVQKTLF